MRKNKMENKTPFSKAPFVERINIELDINDQEKSNHWLDQQKQQVEDDRSDFQDRQTKYLHGWDDFITSTRKGPWNESSNLHLPLTAIMVKSLHARFYEIFTNPNTTQLKPREKTDSQFVYLMEKLRQWYLWDYINGYKGIRGFAREVFYDVVTVGFGIGLKDFEVKERKMIFIEPNEVDEFIREAKDLEPQMKELSKIKKELETDEEMEKRVDISPYKEIQKIIKIFEGTTVKSVPWENAYFKNDIPESNDLDATDYVMIETEMSASEIRMKANAGIYDPEEAEAVAATYSSTYEGSRAGEIRQRKDRLSGINHVQSLPYGRHIVEHAFATYDIDGDGIDEEIIVTRSGKSILNINYLDRVCKQGLRPIVKFDCFAKPRQAYSRGAVEYIHPIQEEIDLLHNKRQDLLTLQTTPFGIYRAGSSLKREPVKIAPGKLIPADDTSDVRLLSWGANASVLVNEQQILWQYAERMLSVTALSQGAMPETVGALRSTSGVLTMLKQMQKEFIASIDHNATQWKKLEQMILYDLDTKINDQVKLRILGPLVKDPVSVIRKYTNQGAAAIAITSQFDVQIDVASAINSEEVRRNDAMMIMQATLNPSLAQQLGIIGPKGISKAMSDYYYSMGQDPDDFMDEPEMTGKALTLYQEIQICGQGETPPMAMQDDHQTKAQDLMQFTQTPEFVEAIQKGIFVPNAAQYMQKAAQKHMMLFESLQPKGMPNPSGNNNANLNEQLAGTAPQQGGQNPESTTSRDLGGQRGSGNTEAEAPVNQEG